MKNNLQYYIDEIRRQNPGLSDKDVNTYANKFYKMDPNSDYTGKRTKADPAFKLFNANAKAGTTAAANVTPTPTPTKDTKVIDPINDQNFTPIGSGIQTNFQQFVDGTLNRNAGGPGSISMEPFITGRSTPEQPNPKPIVILPTADGKQFIVGDLDQYVSDYIKRIPSGDAAYYKTQLKDYYTTTDAFQRSVRSGPISDKDEDFVKAIKKVSDSAQY